MQLQTAPHWDHTFEGCILALVLSHYFLLFPSAEKLFSDMPFCHVSHAIDLKATESFDYGLQFLVKAIKQEMTAIQNEKENQEIKLSTCKVT